MKWPWFIAGLVGLALSAIPIFIMTAYLPGQVLPYAIPGMTAGDLTPEDLIDGRLVAFVQDVFAVAPARPAVVLPVRLRIPALAIDAALEYVGLTPDGAMDVPKSPENVGWFKLGTRPGEEGSAVIAGHYGRKDGTSSAFDDLHMLRPGHTVHIEYDDGTVASFVVRRSRRYDPKADAAEVFGSHDGRSHLNLVTCEGEWDAANNGYPTRLVVFTDKETE